MGEAKNPPIEEFCARFPEGQDTRAVLMDLVAMLQSGQLTLTSSRTEASADKAASMVRVILQFDLRVHPDKLR